MAIIASTALLTAALPVSHARASGQSDAASESSGPSGPDITSAEIGGQLATSVSEHVVIGASGEVTPSGAFTTSLDIEVAPGIRGVQPSLALTYDSQAGDGLVGSGFTLTGLPAIVRQAGVIGDPQATEARYGVRPNALSFDGHDSFSVVASGYGTPGTSGSRLVETVSGTGLFHTAAESWVQYRPLGRCVGPGAESVTFSPCAWEARDGAGNVLLYGARPSGRLWERDAGHDNLGAPVEGRGVQVWALTHFFDVKGHAYRVQYEQDDAMLWPLRIEYGCDITIDPGQPQIPEDDPGDDPDDEGETGPPPFEEGGEEGGYIDVEPFPEEEPATPRRPIGNPDYDPDAPPTFDSNGTVYELGLPQTPYTLDIDLTPGPIDAPEQDISCGAKRSVAFYYEPRPSPTPLPHRHMRELSRIGINAAADHLHAYHLSYETSPATGARRLTSIERRGSDAISALPATTFTWSDGSPVPTAAEAIPWTGDHGTASHPARRATVSTLTGDIDGDGRDDIVRVGVSSTHSVSYMLGADVEDGLAAVPIHDLTVSIPFEPWQTEAGTDIDDPKDQGWSALLLDVDIDGRDDLVLWRASLGEGEMYIAAGTGTGLGPLKAYAHNAALDTFVNAGLQPGQPVEDGGRWFQMHAGDFNGDQISDLALIDRWRDAPRVALMAGTTSGLTAPSELTGRGFGIGEYEVEKANGDKIDKLPMTSASVVGDFDGDGLQDLLLSVSSDFGIRSQVFLGHAHRGMRRGMLLDWLNTGGAGAPPHSSVTGDFNADGVSDVLYAYSGSTRADFVYWGRSVWSWLGQPDLLDLTHWFPMPRRDAAIAHLNIMANTPYPESAANDPIAHRGWATWAHHSGDFNGDGTTDLAATYDGVMGDKAEFVLSDPRGRFVGPFGSITECAGTAEAGSPPPAEYPNANCTAQPDGNGLNVHRWTTTVVDIDADGRDDLVRYRSSDDGTAVHVAYGGVDGLGPYVELLDDGGLVAAEAAAPNDGSQSSSVQIAFPDLNGDGRPDVVIGTYDGLVGAVSDPGTPANPATPDLIVGVDNGYGATVEVQYESAPRLPGAVDPDTTECGAFDDSAEYEESQQHKITGEDCGVARKDARPIATLLRSNNGRGVIQTDAFSFTNGRYYPGPRVETPFAWPSPTRRARADLGFQTMDSSRLQTGAQTFRVFRQDRPYQRNLAWAQHEVLVDPSGTREIAGFEEHHYDSIVDPSNGIRRVRRYQSTSTHYEQGTAAEHSTKTNTYDAYDRVTSTLDCANDCYEETRTYETDVAADRWILQRVRDTKQRVAFGGSNATDNVLSWKRTEYLDDLPKRSLELVCDNLEQCRCYYTANAETCTAAGNAHWVTTAEYDYDGIGNVERVTDALGNVTELGYDPVFNTHVAHESRSVTSTGITVRSVTREVDGMGRVTLETDDQVAGRVTDPEYDVLGRLQSITHPDGRIENYAYVLGTPSQQYVHYETTTGLGGALETRDDYFDGLGAVYRSESSGPAGETIVTRQETDYLGGREIVWLSEPHFASANAADVVWEQWTKDPQGRPGRLEKVRDPMSSTPQVLGVVEMRDYGPGLRSVWRSVGEVAPNGTSNPGHQPWQYAATELDLRGRVTSVIELGRKTDFFYNDAGSIEHVYGPYDPDASGGYVPFKLWWYDSRGLVVEYEDDASGSTLFAYDDLGRMDWSVDVLGRSTSYVYDELGRIKERTTNDGTTTYDYDTATLGAGQIAAVTGPWGSEETAAYDVMGRPLDRTLNLAGLMSPQTEAVGYDELGRVRTRTLPDGSIITYDYDVGGVLADVLLDGTSYAAFEDYDARGQVGRRTTPASVTTYDYDIDGRLHEVVSDAVGSTGGGPIMAYRYRYAQNGDVLGIEDIRPELGGTTVVGAVDTDDTWAFDYDLLRRLGAATAYDGSVESFAFDPADRITQMGDVTISYPPGRMMQGVSGGIVQFALTRNAAGAVTTRGPGFPTSYDYDADDRLISVTDGAGVLQAEFLHGEGGKRLVKTERAPHFFNSDNHTERYYISPNYEVEVRNDPSTNTWEQTVTRHIDAPGIGIVATITDTGLSTAPTSSNVMAAAAVSPMVGNDRKGSPTGTWFYHSNHLGSTNVVTDDEGTVVSRFLYDPFGRRNARSVGYGAVARQYTGQPRDESTGMYHYGVRDYLPEAGVFLTADEHADGSPYLSGGVFNPAGLNRFAYAYNNPIRYNDPTGHSPGLGKCSDGEPSPQQYPPSKLMMLNRPLVTMADRAWVNEQAKLRAEMDAQLVIGVHGTTTQANYRRREAVHSYRTRMGAVTSGPVGAVVFQTAEALGANEEQAAGLAHATNGVFLAAGGARLKKAEIEAVGRSLSAPGARTTAVEQRVSVDKVLARPQSLWGRSADEIAAAFQNAGYGATVHQSTQGSGRAVIVRITGHREISQIQIHPGGGRHEGAYYKISSSTEGRLKVIDPATYKPTPGEKAKLVPYYLGQ